MTRHKSLYKDQDLTTLVLAKIEHVVGLISECESRLFEDCYPEFISSQVYQNLTNTATLLWSESAEFIVDEYYNETAHQLLK
jgi:hypothetical protein